MKKIIMGVDVSKQSVDVCVLWGEDILLEKHISNTISSIEFFLESCLKKYAFPAWDVLVCAEYTGKYTYPLCLSCERVGVGLWLENPYVIKHSSGLERGKNERLDAKKIAHYACRFEDKVCLFTLPEKALSTLRELVSERELYIVEKKKYQAQLSDEKDFMAPADYQDKSTRLKTLLKGLEKAIREIDLKIQEIIAQDERLSHQYELLCSIEGVGEKTAVKMIVLTNAFRDFTDARKFCCYAGVAPFAYTSGSSIRSRNRVSQRAEKSIKALLHMGALTAATRMKGKLHEYYLKKVAQGKNKMSVLNAVRDKLVHLMFAVIKNNIFYDKDYKHKLAKP
jgi:transposase